MHPLTNESIPSLLELEIVMVKQQALKCYHEHLYLLIFLMKILTTVYNFETARKTKSRSFAVYEALKTLRKKKMSTRLYEKLQIQIDANTVSEEVKN